MIIKNIAIAIAIAISFSTTSVDTSRILGLFFTPIPSHLIIHSAIWNGLVERGHDVTVVTTIPITSRNTNYRHIIVKIPGFVENFQKKTANYTMLHAMFLFESSYYEFVVENAVSFVVSNEVQSLMKKEKFDLVIIGYLFNELHLGIAAHFKCPAVLVWVNYPLTSLHNLVGNPWQVSYVPTSIISPVRLVSFIDRLINFSLALLENLINSRLYQYSEEYYDTIFPSEKYPSYKDVVENVSLVLVNHYFSEGVVRPSVPAMVEIGGIQVKENPDPLPKNLQEFLDDTSEHGAIYFSLGPYAESSTLGLKTIESIYNVLSSLPQKIIWKWDTEISPGYYYVLTNLLEKLIWGWDTPGNSPNILFSQWLPQDDILAHPNIRLFISHGGLGSITEAKHHAVPIVGIPLLGDQFMNLKKVQREGWGRIVDLKTLTESNFRDAVKDVLENPTYKETIKKISKVFRDRPMTPMKTAMFWIEYVIRHNGAPHMQSQAVRMGLVEYYSVDVVLLIVFVYWISGKIIRLPILFIYFVYWLIKRVICWLILLIYSGCWTIKRAICWLLKMIKACVYPKRNKKD